MIWTKLVSGLGNQLFQYVMARQLSILKNVPTKIDISFFETQSLRTYKLDQYRIDATLASNNDIERYLYRYRTNTVQAKILRKVESFRPDYRRRMYVQKDWWAYESEAFKVPPDVYLDGYWQHHKYFSNLPAKILGELKLGNPLPKAAESLRNEMLSAGSSVSIHIRRGDYVTDEEANKRLGILPIAYYSKAIETIQQQTEHPTFFVFSDDMQWVKANLPLPDSAKFVELEEGNLDHVELDLMSNCRHNIIANSSFSWWGAFLNPHPDKIVIAPRRWVASESLNNNIKLQFPSWIQL